MQDLRRTGSTISDFDDSDADPEYKPGQEEQENHDLPQQGRELQEEGETERENMEDDMRVDANDEDLQKRGRKRIRNLLNGKRTYKNN
ncbi:hypothetical protein PoB_000252600 [Plakobranchus ocellatus]|uniref:Uncharacterized protein n=1 Tax=Plakobranchus ocellatus TaxID=259542 RepID=A0AAV3XYW4_9GAST|nr:hypothetical protein PoB_000252600 [Plakobranchus ocellatus]